MDKLRVGVIGLGSRGSSLLKDLFVSMNNIVITAVCDLYEDRVKDSADVVEKAGFPRPFETTDFKEVVDAEKVDCVLIITSWDSHTKIAIHCMKAGIPCASEVGGAHKLSECYELVKTYEETKTPYMFLENCNYGQRELMVLNMVKKGLFGEIVHCSGGYCHDLREEVSFGKENRHYRLNEYLNRNCENYPSHELGPIMQVLDVNRSNRLMTLSTTCSKSAGLHEFCRQKKADDKELCNAKFAQGDVATTVITCENGETIVITLDTTLPRFYSRGFTVRGTKGMYQEDNDSVFIDGKDNDKDFKWNEYWGNAKDYCEEYEHPIWANITEEEKKAGHGGMDYLCYNDFFKHVISGEPMPIDVYDGATIMAITPLSEMSVASGGMPVQIPDFKKLFKK